MNIAVQDIVFPRSCPVCGKVTKDGADICPDCEKKLRKIGDRICYKCGQPLAGDAALRCPACAKKEHHFTTARSLYRYNGAMRQSIYHLKYKNAKEYAIYYGKQMANYVAEGAFEAPRVSYDAVIPVPMYRGKQKKRGYNQAELLATEIGYRLKVPVRAKYLVRVRETAPMKELSRSERKKNLKEAFDVKESRRPAPKSVLLVDDIYTTGATADACSYALRRSGVHRIDCLCLAMEDISV